MSAGTTPSRPPAEPGHWHPDNWTRHFGRETRIDMTTPELAGVRVVVLLTFDTQGDVDAAVPGYQAGAGHWSNGAVNYCDAAERQYDMRGGVQRVLRILRRFNAVGTFPTCGATAEWYPEVIASIAAAGHEVAAHGYWHKPLNEMSADEEADEIGRTTAALERVTGTRPYGWRSPMYTITERTIPLLTEQGYEYDSDLHNDDEPYLLTTGAGSIIEIPGGMDDFGMWLSSVPHAIHHGGIPYGNPFGITNIITSHFDVLYDEGDEVTRVFQYCMHPKITGRPFRSVSLSAFLEHASGRPGVRFMTMLELARLCRKSLR
ncbi:MAG TPA: polysaccharide deacetylase family protein [Candidatus Dormibacteraeota bacterium]